jgi:hypothetical protein
MKFLQKIKHKKLFVLSLVGILFCSTTLYGGSSRAYAAGLQVSPTSGTEAHSMTITWNSTDFSAYGPEVDYVFFVYNNSTQKPVSGGGTGPYGLHNVAAVAASTTQSQVIGGLQPNTSYSVSYTAYARNTQKLITGGPNTDYTTQATDSQPVVVSPGPISGGGPPPSRITVTMAPGRRCD